MCLWISWHFSGVLSLCIELFHFVWIPDAWSTEKLFLTFRFLHCFLCLRSICIESTKSWWDCTSWRELNDIRKSNCWHLLPITKFQTAWNTSGMSILQQAVFSCMPKFRWRSMNNVLNSEIYVFMVLARNLFECLWQKMYTSL